MMVPALGLNAFIPFFNKSLSNFLVEYHGCPLDLLLVLVSDYGSAAHKCGQILDKSAY